MTVQNIQEKLMRNHPNTEGNAETHLNQISEDSQTKIGLPR